VQRDRLVLPALDAVLRVVSDERMATLRDELTAAITPRPSRATRTHAAVGLALDFWTWRRLTSQGLTDEDAAGLMVNAVKSAAVGRGE
jgi:hypothetical protein